MSRTKVTVEVPASSYASTVTKCDLCGLACRPGDFWPCGHYEQDESTIECMTGERYPESDQRERLSIDVCPKCFVEKFVPAVESALGVKFQKTDMEDW